MGPTLHRATRPKLSLVLSWSLRTAERPTPRAMIKGTVMGPVVTPPESKATARNSEGEKREITNSSRYRNISILERLIFRRIRRTATARKMPTPTATVQIRTWLGMEATWLARTCRSGSAMVMIIPIKIEIHKISGSFRLLKSWPPIPSPRGVMETSAPS